MSAVPPPPDGHSSAGKTDKTLICKFWLAKRCRRGAACSFAHGEAEKRQACAAIVCRFQSTPGSKCSLGSACMYKHIEPEQLCIEERVGSNGVGFAIASQGEAAREEVESTSDSSFTPSDSSSDASIDSAAAICRTVRRVAPLLAHGGRQTSGSTVASSSRESANGSSPPLDKTLLCRFWLQNSCSRSAGCRYAHSEEEKRNACKTIMCRFQQNGQCKLGAACLYAHDEAQLPRVVNGECSAGKDAHLATPSTQGPQSPMSTFSYASPGLTAAESPPLRLPRESWADLTECIDDDVLPLPYWS
eukprot:gnl/TRDRNA2_/TRDRNA2_192598_c0_seq1.p1 gnl/TRDRNA2_/TRDRNA2_192598_c0~~gnl/TRDRNA2_/TRDRNA2_192598_c0_seq1.p1  ORF type:complete len:323 (-),score=40.53 gnl/TRDRNA2_/TRDRNA2_192598_c0_seq1:196-1104(-)